MRTIYPWLLVLTVPFALASCGRGGGSSAGNDPAPASQSPQAAAVSRYDAGPRAGDTPVDERLAKQGEQLFKDKGCSACHTFGRKLTGPDLRGVTSRRTAAWIEHQILHPDVMTKEDPISRGLLAQFMLQMPNQGLTPDEARAVVEFFKRQDREAGEAAAPAR